jgi:Protein of unknown function (DUF2905)
MNGLGRVLILIGLLIAIFGGVLLLAEKSGFPLGHLPGDFGWRGKNSSFYFPFTTCLIISAVVSLVLYLFGHLRR